MPEWFSEQWFLPATLQRFVWDSPIYLYLILVFPFLFVLRWLFRGNSKRNLNLSLGQHHSSFWYHSLLRFVVPLFFSLSIICLFIALARPQKTLGAEEGLSEGINIILAIDISESMKATDLKPTRLDAAKEVALQFLDNRINDKIGLVIFAGEAKTMSPLTADYDILEDYLNKISWDLIHASGTAIGDALATAINRLRDTPSESKAVILISDGDNTAGTLAPSSASELAKSFGVRIYTIGIGRHFNGILKEASLKSSGEYYEAENKQELSSIFNNIDQLERTIFEKSKLTGLIDYYYIYLNWAIVLFLCYLLLKNTFLGNALED
jgi:Ca-activated chloride channel family protein